MAAVLATNNLQSETILPQRSVSYQSNSNQEDSDKEDLVEAKGRRNRQSAPLTLHMISRHEPSMRTRPHQLALSLWLQTQTQTTSAFEKRSVCFDERSTMNVIRPKFNLFQNVLLCSFITRASRTRVTGKSLVRLGDGWGNMKKLNLDWLAISDAGLGARSQRYVMRS